MFCTCGNSNVNTLRPRQNGRRFAYDTFKCIFLNENVRISIKSSLKFVPKGPINNNPALVQIMGWRRSGDNPLSEPMMVSLLTHICVTRPQCLRDISNSMIEGCRWIQGKWSTLEGYCYNLPVLKPQQNTPPAYSSRYITIRSMGVFIPRYYWKRAAFHRLVQSISVFTS